MQGKWGWCAALAALVWILGAPSAPAYAATASRDFYGVSSQTPLDRPDWRAMGRGRVGSLRVELSWSSVDLLPPASNEELFAPRPYRWSIIDPTVRKAARHGIRILPTVYGTPNWVARYQGCYFQCHKLGPSAPEAHYAFAIFMRAAAQRYGPGGSFWAAHPNLPYRPIRAWQIWNEQNSSDFWKPKPDVRAYTNLLVAGGTAVHQVDPGAEVILGGMFGEPKQAGKITMAGWDFLDAINADRRARTAYDGIAIHPYGHTLDQVDATIQRWRRALRGAGALDEEIWITEIGWASGGERHPLNVGLRGQAELLDQALDYFTRHRKRYHLAQVNVYSWRDAAPGADNCSWCVKSGLVRYKGRRPKPSWDVFRGYTGALRPR